MAYLSSLVVPVITTNPSKYNKVIAILLIGGNRVNSARRDNRMRCFKFSGVDIKEWIELIRRLNQLDDNWYTMEIGIVLFESS